MEAPSLHESPPRRGLSEAEADRRLAAHGPNRLPERPGRSRLRLFADQFRSVLILVLVGAALLAGLVGNTKDLVGIVVVVLVNACLGFSQEYRAERTMATLRSMLAPRARVRRGGRNLEIDAEAIVPGDLVLLEAGDRVPADGHLVVANDLQIDESALTGESVPVTKQVGGAADAAGLGDRAHMAFSNTTVTRGRGEMEVTATGAASEMGRVARLIEEAPDARTPLQDEIDHLGRRLAVVAGVAVAALFVVELARGTPWMDVVLAGVALAVASIPEGLPVVLTVTLAIGMYRMARRGALMRRLAAVETLGCTTVICSDKTGTLTLNQMTARAFVVERCRHAVSGEGYAAVGAIEGGDGASEAARRALLEAIALCNDARVEDGRVVGDPLEGALAVLAAKGGVAPAALQARAPRLAAVPFDAELRFQATFHADGDAVRVEVVGAPEALVRRCDRILAPGGVEAPLDADARAGIAADVDALARDALRVVGVARGRIPRERLDREDPRALVAGLVFVGLVGLIDPARPEAREALAVCRAAGIDVKMVTGDHRATAAAIARDLGLEGEVVTGAELDAMSDDELARRISGIAVFARVVPEQKVRLVRALQANGHVVAMTGDGVNDAPALKHADIGVAMGAGTDVAKEASTLVLTDDNFATIVEAVREGRTIYDNIVRFVRFQLSTVIGAVLTVMLAPALGLPTPFTPIQILWVNIIMDGPPAVALAFDRARQRLMQSPPRPRRARILHGRRIGLLLSWGIVMAAGTLGVFVHALGGAAPGAAAEARTLAFTTFVMFQVFNVFNARAGAGSFRDAHPFSNGKLWVALVGVVGLQIVAVHWAPARLVFDTAPLELRDWAVAAGVAASVLVVEALRKAVMRAWDDRDPRAALRDV